MNKLVVRELGRQQGSMFGFELERIDDRGAVVRKDSASALGAAAKDEPPVVVVLCQSEDQRNAWLKVIADQIRELKDMANKLENPMGLEML